MARLRHSVLQTAKCRKYTLLNADPGNPCSVLALQLIARVLTLSSVLDGVRHVVRSYANPTQGPA